MSPPRKHAFHRRVSVHAQVRCGFFEIYRGKCFDLLARKRKIEVMEDEHGRQCMVGMLQVDLSSAEQMLQVKPPRETAS